MESQHQDSAFCPKFHRAVELIGRRWTGAIIRAMRSGKTRFCDIGAAVPGLSDRLLSERLKELEGEGIVVRTVIPDTPVRIDYHLTTKGDDLQAVFDEIGAWAYRWPSPFATDDTAVEVIEIGSCSEAGLVRAR
jgi:DNA-binding HxlR family transcriptional regulator